jgi:UTP--glucose-1-phosphate uridylyltransferase
MTSKIKTAIIPIAGLGTRFLPLSKILPKELFPLVDKPLLQYIVEEAANSGIKEIVLVTKPEKTKVLDYFKRNRELERFLRFKKKGEILKELEKINNLSKNVSFSQVFQKEALGDGQAVVMAKKLTRNQPCAVLFCDDIVKSKTPCLLQLINIFQRYQKPIIALSPLPKEKLSSYGIVRAKKIEQKLYEIKRIEEKPSLGSAPSNLAIVGKYIITPEVFNFLEKSPLAKGEIKLAGAFNQMLEAGSKILGYEFEGKWLECGDKLAYLKSNLHLSLNHPQFGPELKKSIAKEKLF